MNENLREFLTELSALMEKHKATIYCYMDGDTYGIDESGIEFCVPGGQGALEYSIIMHDNGGFSCKEIREELER